MSSDIELTRMATAALLREAVLGATRASIAGPSGWRRPNRCAPNKTFLTNTIRGAVSSNKIREAKLIKGSNRKKIESEAHFKDSCKYKKKYLTASTKSPAGGDSSKSWDKTATSTRNNSGAYANNREKNVSERPTNPTPSSGVSQSRLVWTDEESLELRPITDEERNAENKEKSLMRAKRKLRSLNFVAAKDTT